MYVSSYVFPGDPAVLTARYNAMIERFRHDLIAHMAVATETGIVAWDVCPDRATAEAWWVSDAWAQGLAEAGLPTPEVQGLGELLAAVANTPAPV